MDQAIAQTTTSEAVHPALVHAVSLPYLDADTAWCLANRDTIIELERRRAVEARSVKREMHHVFSLLCDPLMDNRARRCLEARRAELPARHHELTREYSVRDYRAQIGD